MGLKFVFSTENYMGSVDDLILHIRYTNTHGEACSVTVSQPVAYNEAKKQYAFIFNGLLAAELRSVVAVQIRSGNTPLSCTLHYSADTYGTNKTGALSELCKALFAYSDRAKDYFAIGA